MCNIFSAAHLQIMYPSSRGTFLFQHRNKPPELEFDLTYARSGAVAIPAPHGGGIYSVFNLCSSIFSVRLFIGTRVFSSRARAFPIYFHHMEGLENPPLVFNEALSDSDDDVEANMARWIRRDGEDPPVDARNNPRTPRRGWLRDDDSEASGLVLLRLFRYIFEVLVLFKGDRYVSRNQRLLGDRADLCKGLVKYVPNGPRETLRACMRREAFEVVNMIEGHDFRVVPTRPVTRTYPFTNARGIHLIRAKFYIGVVMDEPDAGTRAGGFARPDSNLIILSREHQHYGWYPVSEDCHNDLLDSHRRPSWVHSVNMEGANIFRDWIYSSLERRWQSPPVSGSICCICQRLGATWAAVHFTPGVHIIACTECVDAQGGAANFRLRLGSPPTCPRCREIVVRVERIFT